MFGDGALPAPVPTCLAVVAGDAAKLWEDDLRSVGGRWGVVGLDGDGEDGPVRVLRAEDGLEDGEVMLGSVVEEDGESGCCDEDERREEAGSACQKGTRNDLRTDNATHGCNRADVKRSVTAPRNTRAKGSWNIPSLLREVSEAK